MPIELDTEAVLLDGLAFPEGPRWRDGALWFSDVNACRVVKVDLNGNATTVVEVPCQPSGLGWLPDGRLLIVSMTDRRLLRLDQDGLSGVAELAGLAQFHCNDMVVDQRGYAYVGNFGFDLVAKAPVKSTGLILVTPDGNARVVADDLLFPNGCVITPDARVLIVGETFGARLSAFDIQPDGSLAGRRVWAQLNGAVPDGICLDTEGAIWLASPTSREVLRVREGGQVTHRIKTNNPALACALGGDDRRTLFVLSAKLVYDAEKSCSLASGRIEIVRVNRPGAGLP